LPRAMSARRLAAQLDVPSFSLSKAFRKRLGVSPRAWLASGAAQAGQTREGRVDCQSTNARSAGFRCLTEEQSTDSRLYRSGISVA
ncbi:TPA: helix-turn-helix transcriptional regulator, partial [Stenotrophomonas maltophilia]